MKKLDPVLKQMFIEAVANGPVLGKTWLYSNTTGKFCAAGLLIDLCGAWADRDYDSSNVCDYALILGLESINDRATPSYRRRRVIEYIRECM